MYIHYSGVYRTPECRFYWYTLVANSGTFLFANFGTLLFTDYTRLIEFLNKHNPCTKMRSKIFAICYELGWAHPGNADDMKMNSALIDSFIAKKGAIRKPLSKCNKSELVKLVNQFEQIKKHELEHGLRSILKEAGISLSH